MNEYIDLADGTRVENSYVVKLDNKNIAVYAYGQYTFQQAYALFGDSARTATMNGNQYGDKKTWKGFTEVRTLTVTEEYACINLRKQ